MSRRSTPRRNAPRAGPAGSRKSAPLALAVTSMSVWLDAVREGVSSSVRLSSSVSSPVAVAVHCQPRHEPSRPAEARTDWVSVSRTRTPLASTPSSASDALDSRRNEVMPVTSALSARANVTLARQLSLSGDKVRALRSSGPEVGGSMPRSSSVTALSVSKVAFKARRSPPSMLMRPPWARALPRASPSAAPAPASKKSVR